MPELREDPISGRLVIVAPERAARPDTFRVVSEPLPANDASCPFCPGHESMTPPEVARSGVGSPDTPGWRVRVVPNLYPIVGGTGDTHGVSGDRADGSAAASTGAAISGAHDVVILSPAHDRHLALLCSDEVVEVFTALRDRVRHHLGRGLKHVQAFVNQGREAGASIEHPHAQVVGLGFVPPAVAAEQDRFLAAGRDLVAEAVARHRSSELSVVDGPAVAWCPPASATPFEVLVAHRSTRSRFDEAPDPEVAVVARAAREALARVHAVLGDVAYNLTIHTAPSGSPPGGHWYVRIAPRVSVTAGFEHATGLFVNVVPPEIAAAALRDATADRQSDSTTAHPGQRRQ